MRLTLAPYAWGWGGGVRMHGALDAAGSAPLCTLVSQYRSRSATASHQGLRCQWCMSFQNHVVVAATKCLAHCVLRPPLLSPISSPSTQPPARICSHPFVCYNTAAAMEEPLGGGKVCIMRRAYTELAACSLWCTRYDGTICKQERRGIGCFGQRYCCASCVFVPCMIQYRYKNMTHQILRNVRMIQQRCS